MKTERRRGLSLVSVCMEEWGGVALVKRYRFGAMKIMREDPRQKLMK